ncbi:hypothetical protein C8J57DRAFT_98735 [Mycena rebaudengoi]|nr:hypothetical protein C8J57DRAFT_98735 [Mycena rebaudengoi]
MRSLRVRGRSARGSPRGRTWPSPRPRRRVLPPTQLLYLRARPRLSARIVHLPPSHRLRPFCLHPLLAQAQKHLLFHRRPSPSPLSIDPPGPPLSRVMRFRPPRLPLGSTTSLPWSASAAARRTRAGMGMGVGRRAAVRRTPAGLDPPPLFRHCPCTQSLPPRGALRPRTCHARPMRLRGGGHWGTSASMSMSNFASKNVVIDVDALEAKERRLWAQQDGMRMAAAARQ